MLGAQGPEGFPLGHTPPFWEELGVCQTGKQCQEALWGEEGSTAISSSSQYRVCECMLPPSKVQILPLAPVMLCGFSGRCSWLAAQLLPHGQFSRTSLDN